MHNFEFNQHIKSWVYFHRTLYDGSGVGGNGGQGWGVGGGSGQGSG